jgi:hypothetical protein
MHKLGYLSGSARHHQVHILVEVGEPTDAEQEGRIEGRHLDYEVKSALALCGKRNVGWTVLVIKEKLEDPPQPYVCKDCLKRLRKG